MYRKQIAFAAVLLFVLAGIGIYGNAYSIQSDGSNFLTAAEIDAGIEDLRCLPGSLALYNGTGEDVARQAE